MKEEQTYKQLFIGPKTFYIDYDECRMLYDLCDKRIKPLKEKWPPTYSKYGSVVLWDCFQYSGQIKYQRHVEIREISCQKIKFKAKILGILGGR